MIGILDIETSLQEWKDLMGCFNSFKTGLTLEITDSNGDRSLYPMLYLEEPIRLGHNLDDNSIDYTFNVRIVHTAPSDNGIVSAGTMIQNWAQNLVPSLLNHLNGLGFNTLKGDSITISEWGPDNTAGVMVSITAVSPLDRPCNQTLWNDENETELNNSIYIIQNYWNVNGEWPLSWNDITDFLWIEDWSFDTDSQTGGIIRSPFDSRYQDNIILMDIWDNNPRIRIFRSMVPGLVIDSNIWIQETGELLYWTNITNV